MPARRGALYKFLHFFSFIDSRQISSAYTCCLQILSYRVLVASYILPSTKEPKPSKRKLEKPREVRKAALAKVGSPFSIYLWIVHILL